MQPAGHLSYRQASIRPTRSVVVHTGHHYTLGLTRRELLYPHRAIQIAPCAFATVSFIMQQRTRTTSSTKCLSVC